MLDRICDNCMSRVPAGVDKCPKCGIRFENTNPGGALPNGWVLGGRYTVGRYIEIDGEGVTYAAIDANTLQRVVIKEFMPVTLCATRDEDGAIVPKPGCEVLFKTTRMDYTDLYRTLQRLGLVEGLVQVLDLLEENNTAYAIIEKVEGPTLAEYVTKNSEPMEAKRALALMRPLMIGIEAMHGASIIHRGISPENIILESGGTAKLTGFATLALRQQGSELKPKLYAGYSAPEQYAASEFEGRYTDIYSLSAVLYHLVTSSVPESANERKMQDNLRPARAINKEVPVLLSSVLARALRVLPAERIQNISDLRLSLSGEGSKNSKGPLGLSKQQLIIGGVAAGVLVILLLVILIVSIFSGKDKNTSSMSSSVSVSVAVNKVPDMVGKLYSDVTKGTQYKDFVFASATEEFSDTVEDGRIISQDPAAGGDWDGKTPIKLVVSKGAQPVAMPDFVTNKTLQADVERKLQEMHVEYKITTEENDGSKDVGQVLRTTPQAGEEIIPGKTKVEVFVAAEEQQIDMPRVMDMSLDKAKAELDKLGVKYTVEYQTNTLGAKVVGVVVTTKPNPGEKINPKTTTVELFVLDKYMMPDLSKYVNQKPDALQSFLDERGIAYRVESPVSNADASKNGLVAKIDFTRNSEVKPDNIVVVYLYDTAKAPVESIGDEG